MSDAQAGTPAVAPDGSGNAGTPVAPSGDGSGLNAQQQKEYLTLKQKAEDYNRLQREAEELRARVAMAEQMASMGPRATDPMTELRSTLQAQAEYDPASKAALMAMAQNERLAAELWLSNALHGVPEGKKAQVAGLIRNSGYQMSVENALSLVTDPETMTLNERLAEAQKEIERLKAAKPNGVSPASTVPASADAGESGVRSEIKRSEYIATLKAGGDKARALMQAVGSNRTKLVDD